MQASIDLKYSTTSDDGYGTNHDANFCMKYIMGVFGCKEVGGSKKMGKYNCSLSYLSNHRKRKMRKPLFLFSCPFYTIISSLSECYS